MSNNLINNPFAQLFPSLNAAEDYAMQCEKEMNDSSVSHACETPMEINNDAPISTIPCQHIAINDKIERILGITFNKNSENCAVYLEEIANECKQSWIDLNNLEHALFERLLLENPSQNILNCKKAKSHYVASDKVMIYLFQCYKSIINILECQRDVENASLRTMLALVLRNMATALKQPELYSQQNLAKQFCVIFNCEDTTSETGQIFFTNFLNGLVKEILNYEENVTEVVQQVFQPIMCFIHNLLKKATFRNLPKNELFGCIMTLCRNDLTADALVEYNTPKDRPNGAVFENTMFGSILSLSCLPKAPTGEYFYFKKGDSIANMDTIIWSDLDTIHSHMHKILFQLLKVSSSVKEKTISWITDCLLSNIDRGKLMNMFMMDPLASLELKFVSDPFMLNLSAVLLRLCEPIIADRSGQKILKIDPTYGASSEFKNETCLIPTENIDERPRAESYSFVTKIFFLTHKAVSLGFGVCVGRLIEANQNIMRMQDTLQDAEQVGGVNHEGLESLREAMERETTFFRSHRAALLEPKMQNLLFDFNVETCKWMIQVLLDFEQSSRSNFVITKFRPLTFPLPSDVPATLTCVPEFIFENLNCYLPFCKRLNSAILKEKEMAPLSAIVTCIIVMTRGNRRIKNPHLRAGLTETLEALLPNENEDIFCRKQVFEDHPYAQEIVPSLLDVFVTIEMTGESVQFDFKFKYRRAIYVVMDYLWKMEVHRQSFKRLMLEAEQNMEAVTPPIFLRFLNLLINDAVYLLDEALSKMAELKALQSARDAGEWLRLPSQERVQTMTNFQHTGMLARSNNILSKWTIKTLEFLTEEIKTIFSHPTIVDRVTAMLNYFLHHLVGPNQKNLKVKDHKEYEFEPGNIVLSICHIYANLSESDAFCLAISQDGRSYNERLFVQAEEVLCRIGGSGLVPQIRAVATRVAKMARMQKKHEELLADAPEEFLDPIMSSLMKDPVVLPTSHVTVDRSTIARHLLSDQTDPFNRSPLTMEMVTPNHELKERILAWVAQKSKEDKDKEPTL